MFLATEELIKEITSNEIVDIVSANTIQGASIDLRISEKAKILLPQDKPIDLSKEQDFEPYYKEVDLSKDFILKAGEFLYSETIEYVKIPEDKAGILLPRSSLARMGLILPGSMYANPAYEGHLPIVIHNSTKNDFIIPPYYRIMQLLLVELKGKAKPYHEQMDAKYFKESNIKPPILDSSDEDEDELLKKLAKYE